MKSEQEIITILQDRVRELLKKTGDVQPQTTGDFILQQATRLDEIKKITTLMGLSVQVEVSMK